MSKNIYGIELYNLVCVYLFTAEKAAVGGMLMSY